MTEYDSGKIRRLVHMSYFQDGLWDIVLALLLLSWAATVTYDLSWLPGGVFVVSFWTALGLKQKITYPRIGFSSPKNKQRKLIQAVIAGSVLLVAVGLIAGLAGGISDVLSTYFELLFLGAFGLAVLAIGFWWGITRWYLYAALILAVGFLDQWAGLSFAHAFLISGGAILAAGIFTLVRFIRRFGEIAGEES